MDACSAFADTVSDLKRAWVDVWFGGTLTADESEQGRKEAAAKAGTEADRLASARIERFHVQLVCGDTELVALAGTAYSAASALLRGSGRAEMRSSESQFEPAVETFIRTHPNGSRNLSYPLTTCRHRLDLGAASQPPAR